MKRWEERMNNQIMRRRASSHLYMIEHGCQEQCSAVQCSMVSHACQSVSQSQCLSVCLCSCVDVFLCRLKMLRLRLWIVEDEGEANHTVNENRAVYNRVSDSIQWSVVLCSAILRSTALHDWTDIDSLDTTVTFKCTMRSERSYYREMFEEKR